MLLALPGLLCSPSCCGCPVSGSGQFLSKRRPRAPVASAERDPVSGHARLSYRRAAEYFTATTGWTLHQLRHTRIRELKDQGCPLPVLMSLLLS